MNLSQGSWQDGYSSAAAAIRRAIHDIGWARAKGDLKQNVSRWLRVYPLSAQYPSPFVQGVIDAHMDAVGC